MTNKEAVNWIINLSADIGKSEHSELWHYEQALCEIKEILESAQEWIPVSERLPEESGYYLITSNSGYVYDVEIRFFFFQNERRKEWKKGFGNVIAWQPLPEPFKGGDAE